MNAILTIGELLLRLTPPCGVRLTDAENFSVRFGGSEANVATALSGFGEKSRFVTALPEGELGQAAENSLRRCGVDTRFCVRDKGRIGLYYYEQGASLRAGRVIYDRAGSVFAQTPVSAYPLAEALEGVRHLHLSGITPALGSHAAALCLLALKEAKSRGCSTSFDLNYRADLWSEEEAKKAFGTLFPYVDLCIASSDGLGILGLSPAGTDPAACRAAAKEIKERYGFRAAALTVRESVSASLNRLSGVLYGEEAYFSPVFTVDIADRVGGGDAFAAGLLHALLRGAAGGEAIAFAAAANAYKHTLYGDNFCVPAEEIDAVLRGDTRLRR